MKSKDPFSRVTPLKLSKPDSEPRREMQTKQKLFDS
jgi:hypothetical protein